eukprot:XP_001692806.1 predicted protein [Chlamydomonas reinhardtii]
MLQGPNREAAREKSQNVDGLEVADAEPWRRSVDTMLHRAASSLQRGPCTCLSCRGGGTVECAQCKGRLLCELCTGSGLRFPHLAKNHWRQCAGQPGAEGVAPDTECTLPE